MAATDLIGLLKRTLTAVEAASREAQERLDEGTLSLKDQVEIGQTLWRIAQAVQQSSDPIKASLREEALHRQKGRPGRQFLAGRSHTSRCVVVVPKPELKLRSGVDADALRRELGATDFAAFFRYIVAPRREFTERVEERPDLVQVLTKAVDTVSEKPRVTFND
tara:strand:- start:10894 stop:11385 length:492 start_codon:yes stop_codon:yes gene_type:complete